jgi:hypothetical protein
MLVRPALLGLVLAGVSTGFGQSAPRAGSVAAPASPPPAVKATAPAGRAAAKATPESAKTKEEPKIEGITIPRANGTFLGLQVANGNFVLTFYDKEKKKTAVDVARAPLRWPGKYQPPPQRTVLNPGAPNTLTSGKLVRPPLSFRVYLALFRDGSDDAVESFVVEYREEAPAAGAAKGY